MGEVAGARVSVVDFFSGCGGTSAGLRAAGLDIVLGIDNDPDACRTFAANFPESRVCQIDIQDLPLTALDSVVRSRRRSFLLFSACAPCQPFSKQRRGRKRKDPRVSLLLRFMEFVRRHKPDLVLVENVPGFQSSSAGSRTFRKFIDAMTEMDYWIDIEVVDCRDYGVPQRRSRLVVLASRLGPIEVPTGAYGEGRDTPYTTVRDWIGDLPPIAAGEEHDAIAHHRAARLSPLNLRRIRATPEGGGREHWPTRLLVKCHRGGYDGHIDVYSRLSWDTWASGLTTRCISFSNGRFGHPEQDRALSLREAALLQTFPADFAFTGSLNAVARQIGNAVPVLLARAIGTNILQHTAEYLSRSSAKQSGAHVASSNAATRRPSRG